MRKGNNVWTMCFAILLVPVLAACNTSASLQASEKEGGAAALAREEELEVIAAGSLAESIPEPDASGGNAGQELAPGAEAFSSPPSEPLADGQGQAGEGGDEMIAATITIGNVTFAALLYDNEASRSLIQMMPLTVSMDDLNRNEKYCSLPDKLHASATESPPTIHAGEIMCWSGNCLVLFYDTFSNSYGGYVRMGYIEDTNGLAAAVGSGSVTVTFSAAD